MKKIAIFDIDGTIFRSSLLIEITEALVDAGIFEKSVKDHYKDHHQNWLNRKDSYEKYIAGVVKAFELNIKGVSEKDFTRISREVVSIKHEQTYQYTRDLVRQLQEKDYFLLAISNSPKLLVGDFCKKLGFDRSYGRIYETDTEGKFTGKTLFQDIISDKSKILQRAMEKWDLTIEGSIAVGDTEADIPMFRMVDVPICFNPNRGLFSEARKHGWKIVVERKDMFYEIQ